MTIQALIFDWGGVLMRTEDQTERRKWEARLGLQDWELAGLVFGNPVARQASTGQAGTGAVWEQVGATLGLAPDELSRLRRDFWAGDRLDTELVGYIANLRPRCQTAILSNAWSDARTFFTGHPEILAAFDQIVISGEEGMMKPDPEIYRRTLARLGVSPQQAVFVDDMPENVTAAAALGIHGLQFHSREQVIARLTELLP